jgi:hypothetical protein
MDNLTALRARDDLLAVVTAWPALRARLTPSGSSAEPVSGSTTPRLPIDIGVSDLLAEIEAEARFYGQVLLEEADPEHGCDGACHGAPQHRCGGHHCATEGEPVVTVLGCPMRQGAVTTSRMPGLLEQVAKRYGHFTAAEDRTAVDFCDTAHELRRKVSGLLAQAIPRRWAGPCLTEECPGELYLSAARIDTSCRECGAEWTVHEVHEHLQASLLDRLMEWSELVSALHVTGHAVPKETVLTWTKRGKAWRKASDEGEHRMQPRQCLVPVVQDPDLYRFKEALDLAERRVARAAAA